ncbi:MAG: diguanylate cyclase [Oscillospiraceae bacterium]
MTIITTKNNETGDLMKRSIKTKIISVVVLSFLCLTALLVVVSIWNISNVLDEDSSEIMELKCSESAQEISESLRNIEQSVNTMSSLSGSLLGDVDELFENNDRFEYYLGMMKEIGKNTIENTNGALAVYLRFNPDIKDNAGFFLVKDSKIDEIVDTELTDIKAFDKDDLEHVGWYYIPIEAHQPVWMDPYYNQNIGYDMISYIIPMYHNGEPIGIIGMDIDVELIRDLCAEVKVYESGDAFMLDSNGNIVYGRGFPYGQQYLEFPCDYKMLTDNMFMLDNEGEKSLIISQVLDNNMKFFIRVPKNEINEPKNRLIGLLLLHAGVFLLLSVFVFFKWTNRFTRPLLELTEKAQKIAENKLETDLSCRTGDEVEVLSESLAKMVDSLKRNMDYINGLAYIDSLTKIGNSLAYKKKVEDLSKDIAEGKADFALYVMDLNGLKKVNDTYGHEMGDVLIKNAADIISAAFGNEFSYRIGGDEFAVIIEGKTEGEIKGLLEKLENEMSSFNFGKTEDYRQVHISVGFSIYRSGEDKEFANVFRRADAAMYEDKKRKKAAQLQMAAI